jgi:hypothetical protein
MILGDGVNQAADLASGATSIPLEFDTLDDFWQLVLTLHSSPSFPRGHHQLENHEASCVLRQRAFHADCAVPDRREYAFNGIRRS